MENTVESLHNFSCPNCGGRSHFDPESQSIRCEDCGGTFTIEQVQDGILEYSLGSAGSEEVHKDWLEQNKVVQCEKCGAKVILKNIDSAFVCSFCGSPYVLETGEAPGIKPESVIPFKISEKSCKDILINKIKKKFFVPGKFKKEAQMDKIFGSYLPCWTYDANTFSNYTGEAGTYYYTTETYFVTVNGKQQMRTRQVQHIRWRPVSGTHQKFFNDVMVKAFNETDAGLWGGICQYNLGDLVQYRPEFIAGFTSRKYDVDIKDGWLDSKRTIDGVIYDEIVTQIHADTVRNINVKSFYENIKYKQLLVPLWITAMKHAGKTHMVYINGQTGAMKGRFPVSVPKIILTALGAGALAVILFLLIQNFIR